jgi:hypothetical protein
MLHRPHKLTRKDKIILIIAAMVAAAVGVVVVYVAVNAYLAFSSRSRDIYRGAHLIDRSGFVITCSPPLRRWRNAGDLRIALTEQWNVTDGEHDIELQGGKRTIVEVVLVDSAGKQYRNIAAGSVSSADGSRPTLFLISAFGDLPWGVGIREVRVYASEPIHCTQVQWDDWSPM